jgi:hypothetical protein
MTHAATLDVRTWAPLISLDPRTIEPSRRANATSVALSAMAQKSRVMVRSMRNHRDLPEAKLMAAIGTISAMKPT